MGGLVEKNSIYYDKEGLEVSFIISDTKNKIKIKYEGILPDLFREGQGIVAEGTIGKGEKYFMRNLFWHDENYMPPEVKKIIE